MATSRSTPAARWGCFPPTSWRRFRCRCTGTCWRETPTPHSGRGPVRTGEGRGKGSPRWGGSGSHLSPLPRASDTWCVEQPAPIRPTLQVHPTFKSLGWWRGSISIRSGRTVRCFEFIKVLTKVRKVCCGFFCLLVCFKLRTKRSPAEVGRMFPGCTTKLSGFGNPRLE